MTEWSMEKEISDCVHIVLTEGNDRLINLMHRSMLDLATVAQSHHACEWVKEAMGEQALREDTQQRKEYDYE